MIFFFGASPSDPQPDWVDPGKIIIPQADEQQRLLANLITLDPPSGIPLPHFWYLPRGLKAAVVMTGDDHGAGGTVKRLKGYQRKSPEGCSLENWDCVRATSNIFVGAIPTDKAVALANQGFEIGLHVYTGCVDWPTHVVRKIDGSVGSEIDRDSMNAIYNKQLAAFAARYPGVPPPVSNRIDCVTWGDYDSQPQVELDQGIRFDTNYYYWPSKWVQNRPGLFTGSGMPMRFARRDGALVDVYQAATQLTDESNQDYPHTFDVLLQNALGPPEFFGVFTVNMHNDRPKSAGADAIIAAALEHHIPVVSAAQMLRWLDGRDASSFENIKWANGELSFTIQVGAGGNKLQALIPMKAKAGSLTGLTLNGAALKFGQERIAGIDYATTTSDAGRIVAKYQKTGN